MLKDLRSNTDVQRAMSLKTTVAALLAIGLVLTSAQQVHAQRMGGFPRVGKALGLGWGHGNHYRNPATNPDYYNPYSHHNSHLIHRDGMYNDQMGMSPTYDMPQQMTYEMGTPCNTCNTCISD